MRLLCVCGRMIELPSAKPGTKIHCPKCHTKLKIPTKKEDHDLVRWFCPCGQRLKARIKSAGREIKCPSCHKQTKVPFINKHDSFIDAKFLIEDTDTPAPLPPAEGVEEPSLRQERNEELGIIEAEVVDEFDADAPDPKRSPAFDFDEEPLELTPTPHEDDAPPTTPDRDKPISLAGFEIETESSNAKDGSDPTLPSP